MLGVVKRTPKSVIPTHNYPKMAVVGNLPQKINILETFDYNELLKRYHLKGLEVIPTPNFPLIISFSLTSWTRSYSCSLRPVWFSFTFACLTISHNYSTLLIKRRFMYPLREAYM